MCVDTHILKSNIVTEIYGARVEVKVVPDSADTRKPYSNTVVEQRRGARRGEYLLESKEGHFSWLYGVAAVLLRCDRTGDRVFFDFFLKFNQIQASTLL